MRGEVLASPPRGWHGAGTAQAAHALPALARMLLYCPCSLESVRRVCLHVLLALHLCAQSVQLEWYLSLLFTAALNVDTVASLPVCTSLFC